MQIAQARNKAEKFLQDHLIESPHRRPDPESRVMVRHKGKLITAPDPSVLQERLAKRIQNQARRAADTRH